jgi:hypothetical protein
LTSDRDLAWGPFPLIAAGAAVAVLGILFADAEWGAFALGGVLLVAGALRFADYGGLLAIRSRMTDVGLYAGFGLGLVAVAMFLEFGSILKPALLGLLS